VDIAREAEANDLRSELRGPPPNLTLVTGPPGVGKQMVVLAGTRGMDVVRYWATHLPDPDHRALLVGRLGRWSAPAGDQRGEAGGEPLPASASWRRIFEHLLSRLAERKDELRLVLAGLPNLMAAQPKLLFELERFWAGVRAGGLPAHVVLVGDDDPVFDELRDEEGAFGPWIGRAIEVAPLTYRDVGHLLPSYSPRDRILAWAVFGGLERHLRELDADVTLATNIRQAILARDAPLLLEGWERLQRALQSVGRYASVLRALASGAREWAEILAGTPDLASGGQLAPYLSKLQQLGLVTAEASLDARPGARSKRYRAADPFLAFWHRFVLPRLSDLLDGRGAEVWRHHIRRALDDHAAQIFPLVCRDYLAQHANGRLPGTARTLGGLWGEGYDIEPAGTLRTGAAFYGRTFWEQGRIPESADVELQEEVRRTRYGYGKEARLRLLFSTGGFSPALLRRGARSDVMHLLTLDDLFSRGR
jgi:hypothetical protein